MRVKCHFQAGPEECKPVARCRQVRDEMQNQTQPAPKTCVWQCGSRSWPMLGFEPVLMWGLRAGLELSPLHLLLESKGGASSLPCRWQNWGKQRLSLSSFLGWFREEHKAPFLLHEDFSLFQLQLSFSINSGVQYSSWHLCNLQSGPPLSLVCFVRNFG